MNDSFGYYEELKFKLARFEAVIGAKANKIELGEAVYNWFIDVIFEEGEEDYNAIIKIEETGEPILEVLEGCRVFVTYKHKHTIEVDNIILGHSNKTESSNKKKSESRKMTSILNKLFFTKEEVEELMPSARKCRTIDKDLNELHNWVLFGEYLKSKGDDSKEL